MSTSDLYRVSKTTAKHIKAFPNGWGSGPIIWNYLCEEYLRKDPRIWVWGGQANLQNLWKLASNEDVPKNLRLTHLFTFDGAVCPNDKVSELSSALLETYKILFAKYPNNVNNWQSIANALLEAKQDKRAFGFGLSCTSVNDTWINWGSRYSPIDDAWDIFSDQIFCQNKSK